MFKRRLPLHPSQRLKEAIWPTMGWDRAVDYFHHRLLRNTDSTHKIAGGLAIGCAMSFTPFLGAHILLAMVTAWIARMNMLAAMVGTVIGNPWTFPAIFWLDYRVGLFILGLLGMDGSVSLPAVLTLQSLFDDILKLFLPMAVGGIVCGLICWPLAYAALYIPVRGMQRAYRYRRLRRARQRRAGRVSFAKRRSGP